MQHFFPPHSCMRIVSEQRQKSESERATAALLYRNHHPLHPASALTRSPYLPLCCRPGSADIPTGPTGSCEGKCYAFCKCNEQSLVRTLRVPVAYVCCNSAANDADSHPCTPGMSCHAFKLAKEFITGPTSRAEQLFCLSA